MTDDVFRPADEEPVSLLPIHPSCGHRLASLGCRTHHRRQGELVPEVPVVQIMGHTVDATVLNEMVADGELEWVVPSGDGTEVTVRLTAKGKRRAEQLLGLPAGCLDDTEDQDR